MTLWTWVLLAAASAFLIKLAGYLLPQSFLDSPPVTDLAATLTVGLLASLTVLNAAGSGQTLTADSRLLALLAAAVALRLHAPYIVVVVVGALAAAGGRLVGLP
ncbi:AzlD domain-containing protein [Propionicicella superfundia]|uniref:AzlD domain-containing protein n=1 Tax=Propionicicella superfundia TaxID=348582 RepID=UPI0003F95E24|nr:AzlD domain-containing protein [Propionicicella superfundia]